MCGIFGFNWNDKSLLLKISKEMSNRGPDGFGFYSDKFVSLGHRRLSIIDLSKRGKQPMSNEDNSIWIIFNGEIYNFKEIREELIKNGHRFKSDTDTEVIIHAYEEYGFDCLQKFNGMFAFCIYDSNKRLLFLARDWLGEKPLYYYFDDFNFIFASELKSLLLDKEIPRELDVDSVAKFLSFRFVPGPQTILKDIKKLLPAHYLVFDLKKKSLNIFKYWTLSFYPENKSEDYFVKNVKLLLDDSVKKRMISDVPVGAYLSGGIDSSAVVGLMSKYSDLPVKTFSVGFGYGEETDELKYAKLVSERFGTEHKEFIVSSDVYKILPKIIKSSDEPISDTAFVPVYLLAQNAKKYATVVLSGDGSDEIFAGYEQLKILKMANYSLFVPKTIRSNALKFGMKGLPKSVLNKFFKYSESLGEKGKERAINMFSSLNNKVDAYLSIVSIFDEKELKENGFNFDIKSYVDSWFNKNYNDSILKFELDTVLVDDYLMKGDKMNMAFSVEQRVPFLDPRLVEFSARIPFNLKLKGLNEKYILRQVVKDLVPKEVLYRKKQRFYVPVDKWIQKDLQPYFEEALSADAVKEMGFNSDYVQKIFNNYSNSKLYYGRQLWSLLTLRLWYKQFILNEKINL